MLNQILNRYTRFSGVATIIASLLVGGTAIAAPQGELRVASPFALSVMDIEGAQSGDRLVLTINRQIYDGLTFYDDKSRSLQPGLAKSWEFSEGGWIFKLRDDVVFHDGTKFTAKDVEATVEKVIEAKGPISPILSGVTGVNVIDDYTVEFVTSRPLGALPNNLAVLGIAPAHLFGNADYHSSPVGTGPFVFESFSPGSKLELSANPNYWKGDPGVESLVFVDLPETSTRITALESGEIDLTWSFPAINYTRLSSNENVHVETVASFISFEDLFNTERAPFDDIRVREALAIAVDNDKIFGALLGPLSAPSKGALPPTVFGSADTGGWAYDPERAVKLLAEAGYGPGDLKVKILGRSQKDENDVGLAMVSEWADVGVQVEPDYLELSAWASRYVAKDFDLAIAKRPSNTGDADWTLGRLYLSSSNRIPCASEELDGYILAGQAGANPEDRLAAYDKALTYLHDELCGFYPRDVLEPYAWSNKVSGFVPSPATIPSFASVSISE